MGLFDSLLANDYSGLLGGLPASWQYKDPAEGKKKDAADFLAALQQDPSVGNNLVAPGTPGPALNPNYYNPNANLFPTPQQPAPPSPFDARSAPASAIVGAPNAGPMLGSFAPPQAPQAPPLPPAQTVAPAPQPASPQNGPINNMNVGGYQMPQFGSVADYTPQMPSRIANANAQAAPEQAGPLPPALGGNSLGGNLGASLQSFANTPGGLLPKLAGGIGALVSGQRSDPVGLQQQNLKAQYDSLVPLLGPQKALLAVMNPEAGKTLLTEALTNKVDWGVIGEDALGNKQYGWIDKLNQTVNGKPAGEEGGGGNLSSGGGNFGFLAPGVKQVDSSLTGKDYLGQFSPEIQAAVNDYVAGKAMPTGNPRKGFTQAVKMIAQKYGADTGQQVDDTTYMARRQMRSQLSSAASSSLGGQINIGNTAAGHLADLSEKALAFDNIDTGISPLSSAVNNIRGLTTEQAAKMEALKGAAQHYGQEITKFYAGSAGGHAERDRFLATVNAAKSPKELAAILSTEAELMQSRLTTLGDQVMGVLGEEGLKEYPVIRPAGEQAFKKIDENVGKLRGNTAASGLPSGWSVKVR